MSDLWVYVGEGIWCVFWIFLSGESVPRVWEKCQEIIYWTDWEGQKVVMLAVNRKGIWWNY